MPKWKHPKIISAKAASRRSKKRAAETIETNIRSLIDKAAREYGSDIFGFGNAVYKKSPAYWNRIKPQWDQIFQKLEIDVSAEVKIKDTANTRSQVKIGG